MLPSNKATYPPVIKFKRSWSSTWILTFFTFPFADDWAFALSEVITGWISFPTFYSFRSRREGCVGRVILAVITLQKQIPLHAITRFQDGQFPHLYDQDVSYHVAAGFLLFVTVMMNKPLTLGQRESSWANWRSSSGKTRSEMRVLFFGILFD